MGAVAADVVVLRVIAIVAHGDIEGVDVGNGEVVVTNILLVEGIVARVRLSNRTTILRCLTLIDIAQVVVASVVDVHAVLGCE